MIDPLRPCYHLLSTPLPEMWKGIPSDLPIFGGFHKLQGTCARFQGRSRCHRFGGAFYIEGDHVWYSSRSQYLVPPVTTPGTEEGSRFSAVMVPNSVSDAQEVVPSFPLTEIYTPIADREISQHIVLLPPAWFQFFPLLSLYIEGVVICPNRAWIIGGKGRDGVVISRRSPEAGRRWASRRGCLR